MKLLFLALLGFFVITPFSLAESVGEICRSSGYTVATINGVFTDDQGAKNNLRDLKAFLGLSQGGEPIDYQYLLNESHGGGIFDLTDSARQAFLGQTSDYDLVNILNDASDKITTQKVLLVAHSQGNFYANNFYDRVADQIGGIPSESIGVYGVGSPAGRVAGGGMYITSSTDNVINSVRLFSNNVLPSNTAIPLKPDDTSFVRGHPFSNVYLAGEGARIVREIQSSLEKLSSDPERLETVRCLEPQEVGIGHHITGATLATTDLLATATIKTAVISYNSVIFSAKFAYNTTKTVALLTYHAGRWVVATTIDTVQAVGSALYTFGSLAWDAMLETVNDLKALVVNASNPTQETTDSTIPSNTAAVILAIDQKPATSPKPNPPLVVQITQTETKTKEDTKNTLILENPVVTNNEAPVVQNKPLQLVFVGATYPGFGGGAPVAAPQVLAYSSDPLPESEPTPEPVLMPEVDPVEISPTLETPIINAPQCEYSLALDGCLVATTTIQFFWSPNENVAYYVLDKNGEFATTTDTLYSTEAADFSDYTLSISAVGTEGQTTATSSKTISTATIPVAINEIAWMGTEDSSSDEWMELKNNTNHTINLSNWHLSSDDSTPEIALSGSIKPYGFVLLERTDDTTIRDITADIIYSGSLKNSGEILRLSYASSTLDQTPSGSWAAGSNTESYERKTMERVSPRGVGNDPANWATWGSTVDFIKNGKDSNGVNILGTPGARNSANFESLNDGQDITSNLTLAVDTGYYASTTILVATSSVLTIKEGVDISLYRGGLRVEGVLVAQGAAENPVEFNTFSGTQGTKFVWIAGKTGTSTLDHIVLENTRGLVLDNADVEVFNSDFANNESGVFIFNNSTARIENTKFASTTEEAISAYEGSSLFVASSTILSSLRRDAIDVFEGSLTVDNVVIDGVKKGDGIGVYDSVFSISNSEIRNITGNHSDALGIYESEGSIKNLTINTVVDGEGIGIYDSKVFISDSDIKNIYDGSGIGAYDSVLDASHSTIQNISGRSDGVELYGGTSTLSNLVVENGGRDGIAIYEGTASISDSTITGFTQGAGIFVYKPVVPVTIINTNTEGNEVGIEIIPAPIPEPQPEEEVSE